MKLKDRFIVVKWLKIVLQRKFSGFIYFFFILFKRLKYITSNNSKFTLSTRTTTKKSWLGSSRRQNNKEKKSYVTSVLWNIFLHYALSFIHVAFCLFNNSGAWDQSEPSAFKENRFSHWFIRWDLWQKVGNCNHPVFQS